MKEPAARSGYSRSMNPNSIAVALRVILRYCLPGALLLWAGAGFAQRTAESLTPVDIQAAPIVAFDPSDPSARRFGDLEFRGGLVLHSPQKFFGGFSALRIRKDGSRFIALSDLGSWLRGRIMYSDNRPTAIGDAVMAPVLTAEGKPKGRMDTESMAEDGKILYVGLERRNQILRFEFGKKGLLAPGIPIAVPPGIGSLPYNQGLEALEFVPKKRPLAGTLIAISEQGLDEEGNIRGFLIGGPKPGVFAVRRTDGYDVSDSALLPGGDLLVLERKYAPLTGVSMRVRRIPLDSILPGATVDGRTVIEADRRCAIDNMEALSVHRARSGAIVLTLMSDDNYSPQQRTVLLQFNLMDSGASKPSPGNREP